jgi:hypothetical protein
MEVGFARHWRIVRRPDSVFDFSPLTESLTSRSFGIRRTTASPRFAFKILEADFSFAASSRKPALPQIPKTAACWANDTRDRALGDIFALQDEIARNLAEGKIELSASI